MSVAKSNIERLKNVFTILGIKFTTLENKSIGQFWLFDIRNNNVEDLKNWDENDTSDTYVKALYCCL